MAETEGCVPAGAGDIKPDIDLKAHHVTQINVTAEGAANGHVTENNNDAVANGSVSTENSLPNGNHIVEEEATNENLESDNKEIGGGEVKVETVKSPESSKTQKDEIKSESAEVAKSETQNQMDENRNDEKIPSEAKNASLENVVLTPKAEVKTEHAGTNGAPVVEQKSVKITTTGIDELVPATSLITTERDGAVKLRMGTQGVQAEKPVTVITVFKNTAERAPNHLALAVKREGQWVKWTYRQYYTDVIAAAKSFIKLGLEPYHGVGILGFNSPEWLISDIASIFAGGFATGIYATNTPEAVQFVAKHSEANIMVVENNQQLQKVLKIWNELPFLRAVIQYNGEVAERRDNVYSWADFLKIGTDVPDEVLQQRINMQHPNKCCTLIYTSGTTGDPKGVMLSHDNMVWTAKSFAKHFQLRFETEIIISYLPLSHVAAQMIDLVFPLIYGASVYFAKPDALKLTWCASQVVKHFKFNFGSEIVVSYLPLSHIAAQLMDILMPITVASSVYFAEPDALKGSLLLTLKEVRPTGFFGVPRVWEKFNEGIKAQSKNVSSFKRKIGQWARGVGLKGTLAMMNKQSTPLGWGIANTLVFKKARIALGLDRCRFFMSGAAPIMKDTLEFFYSLNMILHEVYGMSESTGPHTIGTNDDFRLGSVGQCFPGAETKLANPDEDGNGEICMYGRHVFMGYMNEPAKTKETFDDDGYLKSGDLGKHDANGFLYITGRIKELIITAGGENIAPVPIEDNVKEALPIISNCMLVGDKRKFLSMILCLKVDVNPDTAEPTDNLTRDAKEWCQSLGSSAATVADVIEKKDAAVLKAIQDGIDKANGKCVSRASKIQKWSIIPKDFSIPGGELGPTLKLRRPVVTKMYKKTLDAFYDDGEGQN